MRCGIPNAYILDITMYKMHVSLCYYCTIRILICHTLKLVIYIIANYKICQEHNIDIGKTSLYQAQHYCIVFNVFNTLTLIYVFYTH